MSSSIRRALLVRSSPSGRLRASTSTSIYRVSRRTPGGGGIDTLIGIESVTGTNFNDTLIGNAGNNTLSGLGGNDILNGGAGNDRLLGGAGNDTLLGGTGTDTLLGGTGDDTITSDGDGGTYRGEDGNDFMRSGLGPEFMDGGVGIDTIDHTAFNGTYVFNMTTGSTNFSGIGESYTNFENVRMGNGNDTVTGNAANNEIRGGGGNDTLSGLGGNDRLIGGSGADTLTSGSSSFPGQNVFVYENLADSFAGVGFRDTITDFASSADNIDVSGVDANSIAAGNQAFTFIGSAAFSSFFGFFTPGQLRYSGGVLQGNTDFDGAAEFEIVLSNFASLSASDIVL